MNWSYLHYSPPKKFRTVLPRLVRVAVSFLRENFFSTNISKKNSRCSSEKCKQFASCLDRNKLAIWRKKFPLLFRPASRRVRRANAHLESTEMDINSVQRSVSVVRVTSRVYSQSRFLIRRRKENFPLNPSRRCTRDSACATRHEYTRARSGTSGGLKGTESICARARNYCICSHPGRGRADLRRSSAAAE